MTSNFESVICSGNCEHRGGKKAGTDTVSNPCRQVPEGSSNLTGPLSTPEAELGMRRRRQQSLQKTQITAGAGLIK